MKLPSVNVLSAILLASELALALTKRSKSRATGKDCFTLPLLWTVIGLSIWAAFFCTLPFRREDCLIHGSFISSG